MEVCGHQGHQICSPGCGQAQQMMELIQLASVSAPTCYGECGDGRVRWGPFVSFVGTLLLFQPSLIHLTCQGKEAAKAMRN